MGCSLQMAFFCLETESHDSQQVTPCGSEYCRAKKAQRHILASNMCRFTPRNSQNRRPEWHKQESHNAQNGYRFSVQSAEKPIKKAGINSRPFYYRKKQDCFFLNFIDTSCAPRHSSFPLTTTLLHPPCIMHNLVCGSVERMSVPLNPSTSSRTTAGR